ncbi:MAG: DUF5681 domain-containing protein [Rhizobiaceae bacterium]|nr:DUF5681 domain-containing protein [Rhizobiaceae bacterium]
MSDDKEDGDENFSHLPEDHKSRNRTYETGKFKPPVENRIKDGEIRNPKGRPRGRKSLPDLATAFYLEKILVRLGDKLQKMPRYLAELHVLHSKAMAGDFKSLHESHARAASLGLFPQSLEPEVEIVEDVDRQIIAERDARVLEARTQKSEGDDDGNG